MLLLPLHSISRGSEADSFKNNNNNNSENKEKALHTSGVTASCLVLCVCPCCRPHVDGVCEVCACLVSSVGHLKWLQNKAAAAAHGGLQQAARLCYSASCRVSC